MGEFSTRGFSAGKFSVGSSPDTLALYLTLIHSINFIKYVQKQSQYLQR